MEFCTLIERKTVEKNQQKNVYVSLNDLYGLMYLVSNSIYGLMYIHQAIKPLFSLFNSQTQNFVIESSWNCGINQDLQAMA